ncbi:MAG: thioredoxin [Gammaproteobacteria bacterium]|nr:thioredoxin [Gammaproteobacteria bacterium]
MSESSYVIDADSSSFHSQVIERSFQVPVLVDFWASWCNPCKMLAPVLNQLAEYYGGKVFVVKVDTDVERDLAAQFGIRSLPSVKIFKQGSIVDEFSGVIPESSIRELIEKHLTRESDFLYNDALAALANGDINIAKSKMTAAYNMDPDRLNLILGMIELHLVAGESEQAEALLTKIPLAHENDDEVQSVRARLLFVPVAAAITDVEQLQQALSENPKDCQALHQLGAYYVTQQDYEKALELFLQLLKTDKNYQDGLPRKAMLAIFTMLGSSGPLVNSFRSKMASAIL